MANAVFRRDELRTVLGTSGLYALRMLGLYMALPVMAPWAGSLPGATPFLVGLAIGAYGLTQAVFQVPFGILGDIRGRRLVILLSLLVFALGSALVALAGDIRLVILGRLVQGMGAMASTLIALIGDATREEVRTRAMALMGTTLGAAFAGGFILGPLVSVRFGVPSVFGLASGLSLLAVVLFEFVVPTRLLPHRDRPATRPAPGAGGSWSWEDARALLHDPSLLVLDAGIAVLHASVTGLFVVLPFLLREHVPDLHLWRVYAPVLLVGMAAMLWAAHQAERPKRVKPVLAAGGLALTAGLCGFALFHDRLSGIVASLALFVVGFATVEPVMASLLTRYVGRSARGTAAGVFNMAQFGGAFAGGTLAGALLPVGRWAPFAAFACLSLAWLVSIPRLRDPRSLVTTVLDAGALESEAWQRVHRALLSHGAVLEAEWTAGGPVIVRHWARRASAEELAAVIERAAAG